MLKFALAWTISILADVSPGNARRKCACAFRNGNTKGIQKLTYVAEAWYPGRIFTESLRKSRKKHSKESNLRHWEKVRVGRAFKLPECNCRLGRV